MNLDLIITIITAIASLSLGLIVLIRGEKKLNNKAFLFLCISIIFWAIANYFSLHPIIWGVLFWIRLVLLFAALLMFNFFFFIYVFPENEIKISKIGFISLIILTFITLISALSPYVFMKIEIQNGSIVPIPGILMPLFSITIFIFLFLGAYRIFKEYKVSTGLEKIQWKFIMLGFITMVILLVITQFLLTVIFGNTSFIKYGPIFTLPFIIFSAYSIIKHNLFNTKVIATEILTGLILFVLLIKLLLSAGLKDLLLNAGILTIAGVFGILLIKAVVEEVRSREQIQVLADDLKKANIELRKLDKTKSEFISIASHQLRTPLSAIKGYISMMLEGSFGKLTKKEKISLEKVYLSNERLIALVNDLLNISRIESGRIKYEFKDMHIEDVVDSVVDELKIQAQKKNLNLEWKKPSRKSLKVKADSDKIRQVIMNLVDNAIRYTEKGSIIINLKNNDSKEIVLSVKDTGIGLDEEGIKSLFKRFVRGKTVPKMYTEGTGLGLYIAKKIIEAHKGKIWAESEGIGNGSTFYMGLPL